MFDEKRLYTSGDVAGPYTVGPMRIGSPVCEDAWHEDVAETLAETGAEMLLVPNGSPHYRGKITTRQNLMVARVIETGLPLVYLNLVGGQDDQIFDGGSFVLNPGGALALQLPMFEEAIAHVDFTHGKDGWQADQGPLAHLPDALEQDYNATVLALRDYLRKAGFSGACCSASPAASTAPSSPPSPSTRWARTTCAASCCPRNTPRPTRWRMRRRSRKISAALRFRAHRRGPRRHHRHPRAAL